MADSKDRYLFGSDTINYTVIAVNKFPELIISKFWHNPTHFMERF